jgi:hypothetical protein
MMRRAPRAPHLRRIATLAAALLLLAASSPHATRVVVFEPYADGNIASGMTVSRHAKGDCWTTSLATVRRDAWRCMTKNTIYDPCFSPKEGAKEVACPVDVVHRKLLLLALAKPLPASGGVDPITKRLRPPDVEPWFVTLSDGTNCWFTAGGTFTIGENRANYECGDWWIIGYFVEKKPNFWVAKLAKGEGATTLRTAAIATAVL